MYYACTIIYLDISRYEDHLRFKIFVYCSKIVILPDLLALVVVFVQNIVSCEIENVDTIRH